MLLFSARRVTIAAFSIMKFNKMPSLSLLALPGLALPALASVSFEVACNGARKLFMFRNNLAAGKPTELYTISLG